MMTKRSRIPPGLVWGAAAVLCLGGVGAHAAATVDFPKEIAPIFEKSCLKCHGPDKQKAHLRLDEKAAALKGTKDGPVIVPGKAAKSELYRRITLPASDDDVMPQNGTPLTKAQTDLIRDWINQGAAWPDGLVLKPIVAPAAVVRASPSGPALKGAKPTAAELGAVAKFQALGVPVPPIALNLNLREANFRPSGATVTDAVIAPLKDIRNLTDLNLASTKITDAGLAAIEDLTNLTRLHLEHTAVTDAGLAHLKRLKNLTYLNLFDTPITDAGLNSLTGLTRLQHIYLWQSKVTAAGVAKLHQALPHLDISTGETLTTLAKQTQTSKPTAQK
jgi:Planctomycete cytochrome C/Leucine Rich repeat